MAPPSSASLSSSRDQRAFRARSSAGVAGILTALSLAASGCQKTIDLASIQDPTWVATTIPYTGVREPTRQFPDYSSVDASILDESAARPSSKKGAPR